MMTFFFFLTFKRVTVAAMLENKKKRGGKHGKRKIKWKTNAMIKVMVALIQVVEGRDKKWLDSEYMLQVESTGFADYLDV